MLTDERHDVIRTLLLTDGRVVANELAARFGVSEDTVRRDLRELAVLETIKDGETVFRA